MKLYYNQPKRSRVKNREFFAVAVSSGNRSYWLHEETARWHHSDVSHQMGGTKTNHDYPVNSVRAFRRYVKKHSQYLPTGTKFTLISRYVGHDITTTL